MELNYCFILLGLSPDRHGCSPSTGVNNVYQTFVSLKHLRLSMSIHLLDL